MAPKPDDKDKKKKGPKQLLAAAQLMAFTNIYKGACKRYGAATDRPLLEELDAKLLAMKPLEKVSLRGPEHGSASLRAVLDAAAGYQALKNLACWGCDVGDQGLLALAQLLRASVDRTWVGAKLRLVEIVSDGASLAAERWPERYLSQANGLGGMVSLGPGFQLPSLVMGHTQAVTLDTALLSHEATAGAATPDLATLERQLTNLMASTTATVTTMTYESLARARAAADSSSGGGAPAAAAAAATAPQRPSTHPADGRPLLHAPPPQAFSNEVLKQFSLSLGAQGHMLQVLVLDHNQLGDMGAALLAPGLKRCRPLQQLSLSHCGIGPDGAAALAAALVTDPTRQLAELQPQYKLINLSHNPLGAAGVRALAGSLTFVPSLKVLHLAAVDLGCERQDLDALQVLSEGLAANTSIEQVDLDANPIGDAGAALLLPFLQSQRHLRKLRLTPRLSRGVMEAVVAAVRANLPAAKKKVKAAKKKGAKK